MSRVRHARPRRTLAVTLVAVCVAGIAVLGAATASGDPYVYQIRSISGTAPGNYPLITFAVLKPDGTPVNLKTDPAWTQTASGNSRLFLQVGWSTREFTNTGSDTLALPGGRGVAQPIPVNALAPSVVANPDGSYSVASLRPVPQDANGSGTVAMEGHPAGQDASGNWTLRVPVRSVYKNFRITDSTLVARRQIVDPAKCMNCHKSDGSGVAPRLTVHGNNRTEQTGVCVLCHNPNNTDAVFRVPGDPRVVVGPYSYPEQSIDFKRLVHGIHASAKGFRENPLVVVGFNHSLFDASALKEYPAELKDCVKCHVDDGTKGSFELPLAPTVLGSTFVSKSILPDGTVSIDTDPVNDVKITPTAAVCSSCHDKAEVISHMVRTGGASFRTSQAAIASGAVKERCVNCHGAGKDESVRKVHLSHDD